MREGHHGVVRPIDELCDRIVAQHHVYFHRALPHILDDVMALTDADSRAAAETRSMVTEIVHELRAHLAKEEIVLFPALVALAQADRNGDSRPALPFPTVLHPIRMMEAEHARIDAMMARLRALTHDFVPPDDSTGTWRLCLSELSELDEDLREDHRIENEELFPRALELEQRLP